MLKHRKSCLIALGVTLATSMFACSYKNETTSETYTQTENNLGLSLNGETLYPKLLYVTEINNNSVYAVDRHGEEWCFESEDAWVGDLYACIMSDNGTSEMQDDKILSMRFVGEISEYETKN